MSVLGEANHRKGANARAAQKAPIIDDVEIEEAPVESDLISVLSGLEISNIPSEEVERAWRGDGTDNAELGQLYSIAASLDQAILTSLLSAARAAQKSNDADGVLGALAARDWSPKALVALLKLVLDDRKRPAEERILAGSLYFVLLSHPSSAAYGVFHSWIFRTVMNMFRVHSQSLDDVASPEQGTRKRKKKSQAGRTSKRTKRAAAASEDEANSDEAEEPRDKDAAMDEGTAPSAVNLHPLMSALLSDAVNLFDAITLSDQSSLSIAIEMMGEVSRLSSVADESGHNIAYKALTKLMEPRNGNPADSALLVLRHLLPSIVMTGTGSSPATSRKAAVDFVCSMTVNMDQYRESLHALLQQICMRVPDRAEPRAQAAQAISAILASMQAADWQRFTSFISTLSRNTKPAHRGLSVEVALDLLSSLDWAAGKAAAAAASQPVPPSPSGKALPAVDSLPAVLAEIIFSRASDAAAQVRAKALGCLAEMVTLTEKSPEIAAFLEAQYGLAPAGKIVFSSDATAARLRALVDTLMRRANDEKPVVRKAALSVFESLALILPANGITARDLSVLVERCADASLAIRKQAITSLTQLMRARPESPAVASAWLAALLPTVQDPEITVQERCLDCVEELIMQRVVACASKRGGDESVWTLLAAITPEINKYFQRVLACMAHKKRIPASLTKALQKILTESPAHEGAWFLLAELAPFVTNQLDANLAASAWDTVYRAGLTEGVPTAVLKVMAAVAPHLDAQTKAGMAEGLQAQLLTMNAPTSVISLCVQTLEGMMGKSVSWVSQQLAAIDAYLSPMVIFDSASKEKPILSSTEAKVAAALFTLGELAQLGGTIPQRLSTVVQGLIAPTLGFMSNGQPSPIPTIVRAHAFVALGKLCLNDSDLAKRCISAFARELETASESAVRNNVIVVMCDLCIRYTNLVDQFIPNVATCLRDRDPLVRKHALTLITRLLQEDYVRFQSNLFYRFLICLADSSPEIRQFAKYCLVAVLHARYPGTFFQRFIEAIFVLNNDTTHDQFNQFPQTQRERNLFSLPGEGENKKARMEIYSTLLAEFTDEQRFHLTAKLTHDVLACVGEGKLTLEDSNGVIGDTLNILASNDMRLTTSRTRDDDEEDTTGEKAAMAQAKTAVITKLVKKNTIENIVPVVIELKHIMEKQRSALLGNLMAYLKVLLRDYKNEVADILVADKQLAAEIAYDMRIYDEAEAKKNAPPAASPAPARHGAHPSPSPARILVPAVGASPAVTFSVPRLRATPGATPRAPNVSTATDISAFDTPSKSMLLRNTAANAMPSTPLPMRTPQRPQTASRVPAVPQSPMPTTLPFRLYSEDPAPKATEGADVVLYSPDKPLPPPRQWNVTVPEEGASTTAAAAAPKGKGAAKGGKARGKKRRGRTSDESEKPEEDEEEIQAEEVEDAMDTGAAAGKAKDATRKPRAQRRRL